MRILMSGASGFVGGALCDALANDGHDVVRLVRRAARDDHEAPWDPASESLDPAALGTIDAAIHLAGENIAGGRWTTARKARIVDSRVKGTRTLVGAITKLDPLPKVLLSASAMGFYGARGDEEVDEGSAMGEGFLAETCRDWEAETAPAVRAGIRVCQMRIGLVLGEDGGALPRMLLPFKLGLGGRLGDGKQWMSWIDRDDVVAAFLFSLTHDSLRGPVNLVAPRAVTNAEFTKTLGKVLRRPTLFGVPAFVLRTLLGEMADGLLLTGAHVHPKRLQDAGFEFRHADLEGALREIVR